MRASRRYATRIAAFGPLLAVLAAVLAGLAAGPAAAQEGVSLEAVMEQAPRQTAGGSVRPPADAAIPVPTEPGVSRERDLSTEGYERQIEALRALGVNSDTTLWGEIRHGAQVTTQASNPNSDFLVQDAGMAWQKMRAPDGPLRSYGGMGLFAILALLFLFYLYRGRIEIEHGRAGTLIERFNAIERFGHWLLAVSFILLALTGLNMLYGRDLLIPLIGKAAFADLAIAGKWVHNNVAWAFMAGLVLVFVMWVWHNLPSLTDLRWIAEGGGLFVKGKHPPARKFNAGQKLIFWAVIILGASISASGLSLLFPYTLPMFAETFRVLNDLGAASVWGTALPTELTQIEEMQYAQLWHTIVAFAMIVVILAHIYIGSAGMEGAFDAMGTGMVDRNWAEEHHSLWVEDMEARAAERAGTAARPAE